MVLPKKGKKRRTQNEKDGHRDNSGEAFLLIPVFVLITSAGMLLPVEVLGGETGVQVLTLEEALRIAAQRNRDIQKAREYRNWVEGRYVEVRQPPFPTFSSR